MKNNVFSKGVLALLLPLGLSACVQNSDADLLRQQVAQHEQALQQLNMQLSGVQPAQANTWSQVQSMQRELEMMRGEQDNLSHAFSQVGGAQALAELIARHDRALRLIETQMALDLQMNEAAPLVPVTPSSSQPGSVSTTAPAQPTPQPVTSPAKPVSTDTAQALYDSGVDLFNKRSYQQALKSFSDFTSVYPDHKLISNAWFWQGECNYQMENYAAAALAYEKVISGHPNSSKAPASYLKQGMAFAKLDKKDAARERLNHLVKKYPKAPESTRAKQVLNTLK